MIVAMMLTVVVVGTVLVIVLAAIRAYQVRHDRLVVTRAMIERVKGETVAAMLDVERRARRDDVLDRERRWRR